MTLGASALVVTLGFSCYESYRLENMNYQKPAVVTIDWNCSIWEAVQED